MYLCRLPWLNPAEDAEDAEEQWAISIGLVKSTKSQSTHTTTKCSPTLPSTPVPIHGGPVPLHNFHAYQHPHVSSAHAVPLKKVHVEAAIIHFTARVCIYQTYEVDPRAAILASTGAEAVYKFPLDPRAAVCGFEALIDKKHLVTGKVVEQAEAKKEYGEALSAGRSAFLLEQRRPDIFIVSIGRLRAGQRIDIRLTYVADLPMDTQGKVRFLLPTTIAPRYGDNPRKERTHWNCNRTSRRCCRCF